MVSQTPKLDAWARAERFARKWVIRTAGWMADNLTIIDRQNNKVPLLVNAQQREVLWWVGMQLGAGVPVRIMILKARRMGMSTLVVALLTMWSVLRANYPAWVIAHRADATETLGGIAKRYRENLPARYQRPLTRDNQRQVIYAPPHESSLTFATAGGQGGENKAGVGRSSEATGLLISEEAWVENWPEIAAGIMATVPANYRLSAIFEETTANGAQGDFYDGWNRATPAWAAAKARRVVEGKIPLFFSWLDFPEYRTAVPDHYEWGDYDEWEDELAALGATSEQLYWRRIFLAEKMNGDVERFAQEFPATAQQAFRESGRPAISARTIAHHEAQAKAAGPGEKVLLVRGLDGIVRAEPATGREPWYWILHERPRENHWYCVFGDVAEGKAADPDNKRSDLDNHAGACLDRREQRFVAHGVGNRIDADEFGLELLHLAEYFNYAWGTPEMNNPGIAAMIHWKNYEYCFQREVEIESTQEGKVTKLRGYRTTTKNRDPMIERWLMRTRHHPDTGWEGQIVVCAPELVEEEKTFVRKKTGKREHARGKRDDLLFAHMGCVALDDVCPRGLHRRPARAEGGRPRPGVVVRSSLAYAHGIDPMAARDMTGRPRRQDCG